jgi:hypothetical protein
VPDSLFFDTGDYVNLLTAATQARVGAHLTDGTMDSLVIAGRTFTAVPFSAVPHRNILGYPFLSQLGVVGFNHRAQQFILYR